VERIFALNIISVFSSENSKRVIIVLLIVVLGTLMAARKQFVTDPAEVFFSYDYSVAESLEKKLGHIHPLYRKDAFAPLVLLVIPYSLYFSSTFHVLSAVFYWILVIALVIRIIRQIGFDYYFSIVLTMFVLFVSGLAAREVFDISLTGPSPNIGSQRFDWRMFAAPLSLISILLVFRGRLIISGAVLGLMTVIHIKYGLRMFGLLMGCMMLWNLWGCHWTKAPLLKIPWRSVAGFGCCWMVLFLAMYLHILDSLSLLAELEVPRAATPFLSRLGWLIKNEPDDWLISYNFLSDTQFFGFLFLAIATMILCKLISQHAHDIRLKIMAVVLMLSVFIALLFFGYGFLFETFLIDHLPLSWSTMLMLTKVWDLIWVVPVAFTIAVCSCLLLWAEDLGRKFKNPPFIIRKLFLHIAFTGFILLNLYIFVDKKDASIFRKPDLDRPPYLNWSYTQVCTEDTALYKKTINRLLNLAKKQDEVKFYKQLPILENIFDRTLKPVKIEETNNPDVKNLQILYNFKSKRYRLASQELLELSHVGGDSSYFWSCDETGLGLHRKFVKIPFKDFYDVSQWIRQNTPADRGVIAPPYLGQFDSYSQRVSFFDPKRDGHEMYQVKEYYPIGLHRLEALAGPYAMLMAPGIRHGIVGLRGRDNFLSLQREDLRKIRRSYPHYDYLVTENQALSGFRILYSNPSFAIYNISEKPS
jgi:hypothetical protein